MTSSKNRYYLHILKKRLRNSGIFESANRLISSSLAPFFSLSLPLSWTHKLWLSGGFPTPSDLSRGRVERWKKSSKWMLHTTPNLKNSRNLEPPYSIEYKYNFNFMKPILTMHQNLYFLHLLLSIIDDLDGSNLQKCLWLGQNEKL